MSGRTVVLLLSSLTLLLLSIPPGLGTGTDLKCIDQGGALDKPVPSDAIPWGGMSSKISTSDDLTPEQSAIKAMTEEVASGNLHYYVSALQGFGSRLYRAPGMYQATGWLADLLVGNGDFIVTYHNFTLDRGTLGIYEVSSIVLTLPGQNASSDLIYYMFAHDDSVQQNDYDALLTNAPGADDDASGCAAVIEAARVLGRYRFQDTIRFAFFNAEEIGLIGSEYWAQNMSARGENVGGFIDYDMIGYCTGTADHELDLYYKPSSTHIASELLDLNSRYDIDLRILPYLTTSRIPSDIQSFYDHGFDGVMGIEEEFNPFYHSTADTVEKLNLTLVRKSTQLAVAALAEWARLLYVDVSVLEDGLELSPVEPDEAEEVTVSMKVNNTGNLDADGLQVVFYCDGSPFSYRMMDVRANSSSNVTTSWRATVGQHNISARLDPDGLLTESDETNNVAHRTVAVNDVPVASLVPSSSKALTGERFTFDSSSSRDLVYGIDDRFFDLGDGNDSGWIKSPIFEWSYAQDGIYKVSLSVRDAKGTVSEAVNVEVEVLNRPPSARPTSDVSRTLTLTPISFTSGANDLDGTFSCTWDFGDGTYSELADPVHTYMRAGNYVVRLNVTDDDLAVSTYSLMIDIEGRAPTVTITMDAYEGDIRSDLLFRANATDQDGSIVSFEWDLGDGTRSTEASLYHRFANPGTYLVTLTVWDDDGLSSGHRSTVRIIDTMPVARGSFHPQEVLTGEEVEFDGMASSDLEGNLTCIWDFGDGNGTIGPVVIHSYARPGTYIPSLTVMDLAGSTVTIPLPAVKVLNTPPNAFFTVHGQLTVNTTLIFDASPSHDREGALSFKWDFGDSNIGEGMVISHSFDGPGNFTVTLNLTDTSGACVEVVKTIGIKDGPTKEEEVPDDDPEEELTEDGLDSAVVLLLITNALVALIAVIVIVLLFRGRRLSNTSVDLEM